MSSRETVLARVRAALKDVGPEDQAAWRSPATEPEQHALTELADMFAERCADYRATVSRCIDEPVAIVAAVEGAAASHDVRNLIMPVDLPAEWEPAGIKIRRDNPQLTPAQIEAHDGVLTASALAIAETGTIVLDTGPGQGRRALTLVPDLHICVVRASQIVAGVPEAMAELAASVSAGRPVTFISGPSATSDIELRRVEGVHGPRRLEVILAG